MAVPYPTSWHSSTTAITDRRRLGQPLAEVVELRSQLILELLPVHAVANHHGALLAHVQRTGGTRGAHDLVIAATARTAQRTVLTIDEHARCQALVWCS